MVRSATAAVRLLTGELEPVRLATTGNLGLYGLQTIDAVAVQVGDRVLVKNQTNATQNGIYTVSEGHWSRAADARSARTLQKGTTVYVQQGAASSHMFYVFETFDPVIGADAIVLARCLCDETLGDLVSADSAAIFKENMKINGGSLRSDKSGIEVITPNQSRKGVTPPKNEAQIDHIDPVNPADKTKPPGSNSYKNFQILARFENLDKSNK